MRYECTQCRSKEYPEPCELVVGKGTVVNPMICIEGDDTAEWVAVDDVPTQRQGGSMSVKVEPNG